MDFLNPVGFAELGDYVIQVKRALFRHRFALKLGERKRHDSDSSLQRIGFLGLALNGPFIRLM
jgi:hypothetical protein